MTISSPDPHPRHKVSLLGTEISYIDVGEGDPIVFLHGNPTSAYLWRNIIPEVMDGARCLAPDLVGMGRSGTSPDGSYRFFDHVRYLDAWFDELGLNDKVILVGHDWGSALAFHWAHRHSMSLKGIAYMEAIVRPLTWEEWPEAARNIFKSMRSDAGEQMVLERNIFVERILPGSIIKGLSEDTMEVYRQPYVEPGDSRLPTLAWPREIPIDGEPSDVHDIVQAYSDWLSNSNVPKLFINAEPGAILTGAQREFCRSWPNQQEVTVNGKHFIQEDSPKEIGEAISRWHAAI